MVLYFSAYLKPRDVRWQGIQSWALRLLLPKNVLFIALFALQMSEIENYYRTVKAAGGFGSANNAFDLNGFWGRGGSQLIIEFGFTVIQHFLVHTGRFNPIVATLLSVLGFMSWLFAAVFNAISAASREVHWAMSGLWYNLLWGESGLQSVLAILYLVMIGFAGVAWHRARKSGWKKTGTGAPVTRGEV